MCEILMLFLTFSNVLSWCSLIMFMQVDIIVVQRAAYCLGLIFFKRQTECWWRVGLKQHWEQKRRRRRRADSRRWYRTADFSSSSYIFLSYGTSTVLPFFHVVVWLRQWLPTPSAFSAASWRRPPPHSQLHCANYDWCQRP